MHAHLNTALAIDGEGETVERRSAAFSSPSRSRPRPTLYLASSRRPNGTLVTYDIDSNPTSPAFDNAHKTDKYDALQGWSNAAGGQEPVAADQGNRLIKRGPQGETVYVNQFYTQRPGATGTKHIYAGTTRIASKLLRQDVPNSNPNGKTPFEKDLYFYHPDHLGTSNYITDINAKLYEHLEYFPFGEAWVEENSNTQRTPYLFTAKELDEETGLYYFGARYYDPRTSVWQSADLILSAYLNGTSNGGVYRPLNLNLYSYAWQNPTVYRDPDGREVTRDAVISFSTLIQNVRDWENRNYGDRDISPIQKLGAFNDQIVGNARFGSGGSFSSRETFGPSNTSTLGWHYIYTSEGWIDFGHFSEAAYWSNKVGETLTKLGGDSIEGGQFLLAHIPGYSTATKTSAFTREDYGSNRLGAEFATYLESYQGNSLGDALEGFLSRYNPSENPSSASDYLSLPATQDELAAPGYFKNVGNAWTNMFKHGFSGFFGTVFTRSEPAE